MRGTTPEGVRDEQEAARWVRGMFDGIAPRYDLANHLLSANIDRYWRARTVRRVRPILERADARVLDICCGTADLALALAHHHAVLASDFSHPMLLQMSSTRASGRSRMGRTRRTVRSAARDN